MINIGVIGCGYWGPNLIRNFNELSDSNLLAICDLDESKLNKIKRRYPYVKTFKDYHDLLRDSLLEAVVVATPAFTHYSVVKECILAGKDTFVEKPLTLKVEEGREILEVARRKRKILMVGHLLEYHPAINKLKEYIDKGELGDIYYIYSQRVNLGEIKAEENALFSFAPHDISVILYLLGKEPEEVSAQGMSYLQNNVEDVVFITLYFPGKVLAHIHVSWLDPHKIRKMTIVGSKKMAVFDDMETANKLILYDRGVKRVNNNHHYNSFGEALSLRFGDIHIPRINSGEPLKLECQHFLDCIKNKKKPKSDGKDGLRVVKILEAAQKSLKAGGKTVIATKG